MSAPNQQLCRKAMNQAMVRRAEAARDASEVAEAALGAWRQMAGLLGPVIGAGGVDAIFQRSLHLTATAFPSLTKAATQPDPASRLELLREALAGGAMEEATQASCCLLETFTAQLTILIGESLTERMLNPVWTVEAPPPAQEAQP